MGAEERKERMRWRVCWSEDLVMAIAEAMAEVMDRCGKRLRTPGSRTSRVCVVVDVVVDLMEDKELVHGRDDAIVLCKSGLLSLMDLLMYLQQRHSTVAMSQMLVENITPEMASDDNIFHLLQTFSLNKKEADKVEIPEEQMVEKADNYKQSILRTLATHQNFNSGGLKNALLKS
ncbi:hypothetical protein Sjap_019935 [Stephania japonica]|uniref:Uncharacterized protein n=1 Tax=Stephania japonica TaxID=461633 RepID=A0AAP0EZQ5_9MAGN